MPKIKWLQAKQVFHMGEFKRTQLQEPLLVNLIAHLLHTFFCTETVSYHGFVSYCAIYSATQEMKCKEKKRLRMI